MLFNFFSIPIQYVQPCKGNLPTFDENMELRLKIPKTFKKYTSDFIQRCLNIDPKNRPSFVEICDELTNNYAKIFNISEIEENDIKTIINQSKIKIGSFK